MKQEGAVTHKSWFKTKVIPFLFQHFLVVGILVALFVGFVVPQPGAWVGNFKGSSYICVIIVFLHSGFKLKTAEINSVVKQYKALILGICSIMFLSPIIGCKLSQLLPFEETLSINENRNSSYSKTSIVGPREFLIGLEFYYISPCAVASGVVLTSLAGGDVTLAILLTVTTNTLGVLFVPLSAKLLVSVSNVKIDIISLLAKLISTLLIPLLIGKALSYYLNVVKAFVEKHSKVLKIISLIFLICIPWMKISEAKSKGLFRNVSIVSLVIMFFWGFGIHLLFIVMNYIFARLLCLEIEARKTLVIMGSLKTLAVTLSIISFLPAEFGSPGLMSIPLIITHLTLIIFDSVWAVHWNANKEEIQDGSTADENSDASTINEEYNNKALLLVTSV